MARKKEGSLNKSQVIRDMFQKHGAGATAGQIVDACKAAGVEVSQGLVYQVKNKLGTPSRRGRRGRPGRKPGPRPAGSLSLANVLAAKDFASSCGGIANAKQALAALESLI